MAAKELLRVRLLLVESVSIPIIKQLLDYLWMDKFLCNEEKYAILEEKIRADQARVLIDSVRRKGDRASKKMFEYLQKIDPMLYHELNLRLTEDAQPAVTGAEWSPTLKHTTEAFWRQKQKDIDVYPATTKSIRNRVALLITNIKFTIEDYNRNGAEKDEENMEKLLSALGYEVVKHTNLTAEEIDNALDEFSRHSKLQHTDSVIVVIMSHGDPGSVFGINHNPGIIKDEFLIDEICKHLGPQKCAALLDKPKIIIIQACRGGSQGSVPVECSSQAVADEMQSWPSPSAEHLEEDSFKKFEHEETDFIFLHSSTRDAKSYRDPEKGSLLILAIVDVVNTLAHKYHIVKLFMRVARYVRHYPTGTKKQMPCSERCTLDREFYLFPGVTAARIQKDRTAEKQWSKTLIHTSEAFWREKQKDTHVYPVTQESVRNRVALLITNVKFIDKEDNRNGAEKDEENMYNLLSALGYDVVKHTNLTAKEIDKALDEFSRHSKLQHTDSVIVVIMSYGNPGSVLGINHIPHTSPDEFPIDNIWKHLGSENCAALLNKPKIIIVQACRREAEGSVPLSDGRSQEMTDAMKPYPSQSAERLKDGYDIEHIEKDFIFLHSSTRDNVSYRDPDKGSPLILAIVDVFNTLAHENSIEKLFLRVGRYVRDYLIGGGEKQMPYRERCSLDRHFYLFPGIGKRNLLPK